MKFNAGRFHVVSYSGGKDSTAMLLLLKKNNVPIDEIIYIDVGDWMWNFMDKHIKKVEHYMGKKITKINVNDKIWQGFEQYGFPSMTNRWCTSIKFTTINKYIENKYNINKTTQYIGYTVDEPQRVGKKGKRGVVKYPLIENKITNNKALMMCRMAGFDFGGIYSWHSHLNCWCCPLQTNGELYYLYKNYPKLWKQLRCMQDKVDGYFKMGLTIYDFEDRFESNPPG